MAMMHDSRDQGFGERLLKLRDVEAKTGFRKSIIYEWIESGHFPAPHEVIINGRVVGKRWKITEVDHWIEMAVSQHSGVSSGVSSTKSAA